MPKEGRNIRYISLQRSHEGFRIMPDIVLGMRQSAGMDRSLQSMVKVFIRVALRRIGRQEKEFQLIPVLIQPCRDLFPMMDFQIVQDQKNFVLRCTNQAAHKSDQPLLVHGFLIQHKAYLSLTGQSGDHIEPFLLGFYRQHRRMPLGREAAFVVFTIADAGLIPPVNDCVFFLRTLGYGRIFLFFPSLDAKRILFSGTFYRALAAHALAPHVVGGTSVRHLLSVPFPDKFTDFFQRPQAAGKSKFLGRFLDDALPYFGLLVRGQQHILSRFWPPLSGL